MMSNFSFLAHVIPGVFLILLCFVGCDPYVCVAIITLSLGFNGAATMTNLQNSQDLAPNYAGSLYGMVNFVGTTSGFISPIIVAHFTQERVKTSFRVKRWRHFKFFNLQSSMDEWQYIFGIGAMVYIVPAIIFMLIGSGEVQEWNSKKDDDANSEEKATRM